MLKNLFLVHGESIILFYPQNFKSNKFGAALMMNQEDNLAYVNIEIVILIVMHIFMNNIKTKPT